MRTLCEKYDASSLQQLYKIVTGEDKELTPKNVYPVSLVQSTFDATTGTRLDHILSLNNCVYIPYKGTSEDTRLAVIGDLRRKGVIVTFRDLQDHTITQRYNSDDYSDEAWQNSDNWEAWDFDSLYEDVSFMVKDIFNNIEQYPNIVEHIDSYLSDKLGFETTIVSSLPSTGNNRTIYLIKNFASTENKNIYDEYIWIESTKSYEKLGSFKAEIDLSNYVTNATLNTTLSSYLTTSTASNTYLTKTTAASTYLTTGSASNTYLSKTDAGNTYQVKGNYIEGEGLKTINGESLLGSGDITIEGGLGELPIASTSTLGGIKQGSNVTINSEGVLSISKENVQSALGFTPLKSIQYWFYTNNLTYLLDTTSGTPWHPETEATINFTSSKISSMLSYYRNGYNIISKSQDSSGEARYTTWYLARDVFTTTGLGVPGNHPEEETDSILLYCRINDTVLGKLSIDSSTYVGTYTLVTSNSEADITGPDNSTDNAVVIFDGTTGKVVKDSGYTIGKSVPSNAVFTDTHYTTNIYAGSGSAVNASTTNGNTKITIADNNTARNSVTIKGSGATTVTSDASGNITVSSTDNNTTYSNATTSTAGLMSAADKSKLDGISTAYISIVTQDEYDSLSQKEENRIYCIK